MAMSEFEAVLPFGPRPHPARLSARAVTHFLFFGR